MKRGMGGAPNMNKMMKQMQKMQKDMDKVQAELAERQVEATSGGGVVRAVVSGSLQLLEVIIEPEAVDPEDVEMLQDLVVAAVNEGYKKAQELANTEMAKITGGVNLPF